MKKICLLLGTCGAGLLLCCSGCKDSGKQPAGAAQKMPPPAVVTGKVELKDNIEKRSYTGVVTAPAVVTLMPRISGEIRKVGFSEGQIVTKDQILYEFDKTRYKAAVENAKARVAESKAKIAEADARIAETQARLTFAQIDFDRQKKLHMSNAAAKAAQENAQSTLDAAKAANEAAKAAKAAAHASQAAAEAQLITAQDDLDNCEIKSPINGVIGINNFAVGNYVTPASGAMATINQITPIRVEFAMSNRDFLEMFGTEEKLKKEAKVILVLANDKEFSEVGTVEFIDNNVNRRTDTIQVFANFPNKLTQLRPGSSVTVKIERKIADKVPVLPPSAVMAGNGNKFYVYVVDENNMAQKREIKVSTQRSDYVFVSEGLKEGETVVVDGTHKIRIMKPGTPFPVVPTAPAPVKK